MTVTHDVSHVTMIQAVTVTQAVTDDVPVTSMN